MRTFVLSLFVTVLVGSWSASALAQGRTDDFGYTWTDSLFDAETYGWVDISEDPEALELSLDDDEGSGAIDIGFPFTFYGETFDELYVHSNAFITFEEIEYESFSDIGTVCPLPRTNDIDGGIYFYVRDWNPLEGGTIHTLTMGAEPNRTFVVQFTAVAEFTEEGGLIDPVTIEAILHEGTNDITVQVLDSGEDAGGDGMIGVESPDGLSGVSYQGCLVQDSLPDETAIRFAYPTTDLAVVPHARQSTAAAGQDADYSFTVYNRTDAEMTLPLTITSEWGAVSDPATEIVVPANDSASLDVTVSIPGDATAGETNLTSVSVQGVETIDLRMVTGVPQAERGPWQRVANLPSANDLLVVGTTDEAIWVAGGRTVRGTNFVAEDVLTRYDIATNVWTSSQDGDHAPLPDGRFLSAGCALDGHLYVIGGLTSEVVDGSFVLGDTTLDYDIAADAWSENATLPEPRYSSMAACDAAGSRVFVFGGYTDDADGDDANEELLDVAVYDVGADSWSAGGTMTASRTSGVAVQQDDGTIVLAGGFYSTIASPSVEAYDIAGETFSPLPNLPASRIYPVGGLFEGEVCIGSGAAGGLLALDWLCLADGMWITQLDALATALLPAGGGVADGRMYTVGGGDNAGAPQNVVQRYPSSPLPEADGDADADADGDADGDGDVDADADSDGDDGGCCTVAPGAQHGGGRTGLVVLVGLFVGAAALRRRAPKVRS